MIDNNKFPAIVLKDATFKILQQIIEYIYRGSIDILEDDFPSFKSTCQSLRINIELPPEPLETTSPLQEETEQELFGTPINIVIKEEPEEQPVICNMLSESDLYTAIEGLKEETISEPEQKKPLPPQPTGTIRIKNFFRPPCPKQPTTAIAKHELNALTQRLSRGIEIRRVKVRVEPIKAQLKINQRVIQNRLPIQNAMKASMKGPIKKEEQYFVCQHCLKKFNVNKRRNAHSKYCFKNPNRPSTTCPICQMELCNTHYIPVHIRKAHPENYNPGDYKMK